MVTEEMVAAGVNALDLADIAEVSTADAVERVWLAMEAARSREARPLDYGAPYYTVNYTYYTF